MYVTHVLAGAPGITAVTRRLLMSSCPPRRTVSPRAWGEASVTTDTAQVRQIRTIRMAAKSMFFLISDILVSSGEVTVWKTRIVVNNSVQ